MPARFRRAGLRTVVQWPEAEKGTWGPAVTHATVLPFPANFRGGLIMTRKRYLATRFVGKIGPQFRNGTPLPHRRSDEPTMNCWRSAHSGPEVRGKTLSPTLL